MLERFTGQACTAIVLSRKAAGDLGHDTIDSSDLVLGLIATSGAVAVRAMTELGLSDAALREHSASQRPPRAGRPVTEHIPFTAELKEVLEGAGREAIALGHLNLTTGHLLLSVAAVPDCAGARALAALGVDAAAARAAVLRQHEIPSGEMPLAPDRAMAALADLQLDPPSKLPGNRSLLLGLLSRVVWFAAAAALIIAVTWKEAGPQLVGSVLVGFAAVIVLLGMTPIARRRLSRRLTAAAPGRAPIPEYLQTLLAQRGITSVEIHIEGGLRVRDRCYRAGQRAWIVLSPRTLSREQPLRFVFGHELAHLLRNDSLRRRVDGAMYGGLFLGAYVSFDLIALAIALISAIIHRVVTHWWAEWSCDTAAARWSGRDALRAWAVDHRALLREPPNRTIRKRLRRVIGLLTHPPIALRLARQPRPH